MEKSSQLHGYILALCVCVCLCVSVPGQIVSAAEEYLRVYNALHKLVALTRSTSKDPASLSDLDKLQKILEGIDDDDDDDDDNNDGDQMVNYKFEHLNHICSLNPIVLVAAS